jgi:putative hydrolase of the HAD superfamily
MERHLFFDLDRTLWDFEKNSESALRQLFKELELDQKINNFEDFHAEYKQQNASLWRKYGRGEIKKGFLRSERFRATLDYFHLEDNYLVRRLNDGYVEISPRQTHLFPEAIETLEVLSKEGYKMHIITNGFKEVQFIKLDKAKLSPYFDLILCSEEVGHNKPSPIIFKHALNHTGAKSNFSVMIGDDYEVDVAGARNCGMHALLFDPNDEKIHLEKEERIKHLSEIPSKLPWIFKNVI